MWRIRIWFSYPNYSRRWERVSYIGEERCVTTLKWLRRWLRWVISFSFFFPSRLLVRCNAFLSIFAGVWIKGHSPFVRTGRRDLSSRRENWTIEPDYQPDQLIPKWFAWQWFFFFFIFRDRSGRPVLTFGKHPKAQAKHRTFNETNQSLFGQTTSNLGRIDLINWIRVSRTRLNIHHHMNF